MRVQRINNNSHSFGIQMKGRTYSAGDAYRLGFNGNEKDDEVKGEGNCYDFGARMYDPRLGRFLSVDPRWKEFADLSPFIFAANDPIQMIDVNGEGPEDRVKAARQFVGKGYTYSLGADNQGRPLRTTYTDAAMKKQDCIELVTRVLLADGVIHSMNVGKYDYYLARKSSIGILLNDKSKFTMSSTPVVGDIAFWEGHVGIVSEVDAKTGKFKLVHAANSKSGIVENSNFASASQYRSSTFYGFYHPVVETKDGKTIDITKQPVTTQENVNNDQTPYVETTKAPAKTNSSAEKQTNNNGGKLSSSGASSVTTNSKSNNEQQ